MVAAEQVLRILTGKKHPQIKLQYFWSMNMDIWVVGTSDQIFRTDFYILKQNFQ